MSRDLFDSLPLQKPDADRTRPTVRFEQPEDTRLHICSYCGAANASFGFGRGIERPRWACWWHRQVVEGMAS